LFKTLAEFSPAERSKFLVFVTGCGRLPRAWATAATGARQAAATADGGGAAAAAAAAHGAAVVVADTADPALAALGVLTNLQAARRGEGFYRTMAERELARTAGGGGAAAAAAAAALQHEHQPGDPWPAPAAFAGSGGGSGDGSGGGGGNGGGHGLFSAVGNTGGTAVGSLLTVQPARAEHGDAHLPSAHTCSYTLVGGGGVQPFITRTSEVKTNQSHWFQAFFIFCYNFHHIFLDRLFCGDTAWTCRRTRPRSACASACCSPSTTAAVGVLHKLKSSVDPSLENRLDSTI
jgi:hypothetical protein